MPMKKIALSIFAFLLFGSLQGCAIPCTHNHVATDAAVAATCTGHGLTEGSHCETCGHVIKAQEVLEPLGHEVVIDEAVAATCTSDGKTAGAHCSRCGEVIVVQNVLEHLGHKIITDEAVDPTCTEHGLTEGSHCETCGEILEAQQIIEALGHDIVVDERVEPTATEPGLTQGAHCSRCNEIIIEQKPIGAVGYLLTARPNDPNYGSIVGETTQSLAAGEKSSALTAVPNLGYRFKSWSDGSTENPIQVTATSDISLVANFAIDDLELPVMEIKTQDKAPIVSKDDYVKCSVSVSNTEYQYRFDNYAAKIRGRGNSTWLMPKKPFKLKFDKKVDLFGNGSAKTWTLIANYHDPSMARNYLAYELGRLLESDYCTTTQFIDLYVNGEYLGVYLVCEQNEVGKNRVEIEESFDSVDTGYLLEMDYRAVSEGVENHDWFFFGGQFYAIKTPDIEDERFDESYVNYIFGYLNSCYDAMQTKDLNEIEKYIDVNSFARSYIVHEMMNSLDVGGTSFYIFKDKGGLLKSGPIWDFDVSSANYDYGIPNPGTSYEKLWAATQNFWYIHLLKTSKFRELIGSLLNQYYVKLSATINHALGGLEKYHNSILRNFEKWQTLGTYVWPNSQEIVSIDTWEGQVEFLRTWTLKSLDYIYGQYVGDVAGKAYSVTYTQGDHYSIDVFATDDLTNPAIVLNNAWSRDLSTGELRNDGTGQAVFRVNVEEGFRVNAIHVDNTGAIGEIIPVDEENHVYRISNITGNINVTVDVTDSAPEPTPTGYTIDFVTNNGATIMVYPGKDYTIDGDIVTSTILEDMSGDGQLNFKVIPAEGYEVESVQVTGSYKNLKGPSDTGAENVYRVTKVAGNLTITVTTKVIGS